jgi:hypothetical protein
MSIISKKLDEAEKVKSNEGPLKRRAFLKITGVSVATTAAVLAGCDDSTLSPDKKDSNARANAAAADDDAVDLGSGDVGILNYAYALEQLEAAFYTMVVTHEGFSATFNEEEQMILEDVMKHEVIHRDFLKTALGANAIRGLQVDFSTIDFSNRDSVLGTAKVFEDLGVAAYNGAGKLLVDVNLLLVAGKIVSVEARHAAAIRDLINPLSMDFSGDDVVDMQGLDRAFMPLDVLAAAQPYIMDTIIATNLPTM